MNEKSSFGTALIGTVTILFSIILFYVLKDLFTKGFEINLFVNAIFSCFIVLAGVIGLIDKKKS